MFVGDVGRLGATSSHVKNLTAQTWRSTRGWSFSSKGGFDHLALLVYQGAVYSLQYVYMQLPTEAEYALHDSVD